MTTITERTIEDFYYFYPNKTTRSLGPRADFFRYLEARIGEDLKTAIIERVDGSIGPTYLKNIRWCLSNMVNKCKRLDDGTRQVFTEVCEYIQGVIAELPVRPLRIAPTQEQIQEDINNTKDPVKKALKKLCRAGLKLEDLARDYFKLSKVSEGMLVVTMNCGRTQPRIIEATKGNPRFGLTEEECNEIIPILQQKIVKCDSIGITTNECFQTLVSGWKYSPGVLRFAHGEMLAAQGYTDAEVAELHGISKKGVRNRRKRYRN